MESRPCYTVRPISRSVERVYAAGVKNQIDNSLPPSALIASKMSVHYERQTAQLILQYRAQVH